MGEKLKRSFTGGQNQQALQFFRHGGIVGILPETLPEACASAVVAQCEKILVVKAEQRRFQKAGQGQIIVRQQRKFGQSQQVINGNLFQKFNPVDAGDIDSGIFTGTDKFFDKGVAPLYQN